MSTTGPAIGGPRSAAARLPLAPGVYRFRDAAGRVLYLGRATSLRRRVQSYWTGVGDRPHLTRMVRQIASVEGVSCDSVHEAAWLERNLLERAKPRWNRVRGGAEVVGYIRFDAGPTAPGLRFVHEVDDTAPHYGPYLGGLRVRQAISALQRISPLGYTAAAGGSARAFADLLGVGPDDRAALAAAVTAVLQRDPAAVAAARAELVRRRDRASAALRFEFAAKLQDEIAGLDWIVAEQKVTTAEPLDVDVYGWAAGVLVGFEVRDGRMSGWRQQPASEASARYRVAATPKAWRRFARRNAELAAALLVSP